MTALATFIPLGDYAFLINFLLKLTFSLTNFSILNTQKPCDFHDEMR